MDWLEKNFNFDPYVGVKLYSFLYDLGFEEIDVNLSPHNMFFGKLKENEKLIVHAKGRNRRKKFRVIRLRNTMETLMRFLKRSRFFSTMPSVLLYAADCLPGAQTLEVVSKPHLRPNTALRFGFKCSRTNVYAPL